MRLLPAIAIALMIAGCAEDDAAPVVSVLVAYTPAVASAEPEVGALVAGAIADTNAALVASGIEGRVRLAALDRVEYVEGGDLRTNLDRLVAPRDEFLDELHARRDAVGADLVVLILADDATFAGLSEQTGATADTAFAVVDYRYARTTYAFAHEVGHLLGAPHAPTDAPEGRTIMTPACDREAECPLRPVYPAASVATMAGTIARVAAFR